MADRTPTPDLLHEALLGKAAESAFFAITIYDDDGHMVAANRRAEGGFDRKRLQSQEMRWPPLFRRRLVADPGRRSSG